MNILFPVFAMFALTMMVGMRLGYARHKAVSKGEMDGDYYRLYRGEEHPALHVISRHYSNLLELPTLLYVVCIVAHVTGQNGALPLALAWAYVALRVVHSLIHLGPNVVLHRFRVFLLSVVVLMVLMVVVLLGMF